MNTAKLFSCFTKQSINRTYGRDGIREQVFVANFFSNAHAKTLLNSLTFGRVIAKTDKSELNFETYRTGWAKKNCATALSCIQNETSNFSYPKTLHALQNQSQYNIPLICRHLSHAKSKYTRSTLCLKKVHFLIFVRSTPCMVQSLLIHPV